MTLARRGRLVTILIAATAAFSTLVAFTLSSSAKSSHSSISIHYNKATNTFSGEVHTKHECRNHRTVQVFLEAPGDDVLVGETLTTANGHWGGIEAVGPGVYDAKVLPRSHEGYGHHRRCDGSTSRHVRVRTSHGHHNLPSTITIQYHGSDNTLAGYVDSSNHDCRMNRTVRVFKRVNGEGHLVGGTVSASNGDWGEVEADGSGHYYATVLENDHGNKTCESAQSRTIEVHAF